jgi:hypothetical protein
MSPSAFNALFVVLCLLCAALYYHQVGLESMRLVGKKAESRMAKSFVRRLHSQRAHLDASKRKPAEQGGRQQRRDANNKRLQKIPALVSDRLRLRSHGGLVGSS